MRRGRFTNRPIKNRRFRAIHESPLQWIYPITFLPQKQAARKGGLTYMKKRLVEAFLFQVDSFLTQLGNALLEIEDSGNQEDDE